MMATNSLAFRLFAAASLWALLALPIAGFLLQSLYRSGVESSFDQSLQGQLTSLIAATIGEDPTRPIVPRGLSRDLFAVPLSGFYWQIKSLDDAGAEPSTSDSLLGGTLTLPSEKKIKPDTNLVRYADLPGPDDQTLRTIEQHFSFGEGDEQRRFSYAVAIKREDLDQSVAQFRNMLAITLLVLGIGLIGATVFQVRYALRPLRQIEKGLSDIRSGKVERLEGDLPEEIVSLQDELNALIKSNQDIISRARTHVGNLAHALKTPLSVINNEVNAASGPLADKVGEQTALMQDQINHHLDRARVAARSAVIGGVTEVKPVADALARALTKIYRNNNVSIEVVCPDDAKFQGEQQDLEEMLGNLMDNACKYAAGHVLVEVIAPTKKTGRPSLRIIISDDGKGLSAAEREEVITRGRRLDETKPGSGLGLSIVADLAQLYRGEFRLVDAPGGGLQAELVLPAVS